MRPTRRAVLPGAPLLAKRQCVSFFAKLGVFERSLHCAVGGSVRLRPLPAARRCSDWPAPRAAAVALAGSVGYSPSSPSPRSPPASAAPIGASLCFSSFSSKQKQSTSAKSLALTKLLPHGFRGHFGASRSKIRGERSCPRGAVSMGVSASLVPSKSYAHRRCLAPLVNPVGSCGVLPICFRRLLTPLPSLPRSFRSRPLSRPSCCLPVLLLRSSRRLFAEPPLAAMELATSSNEPESVGPLQEPTRNAHEKQDDVNEFLNAPRSHESEMANAQTCSSSSPGINSSILAGCSSASPSGPHALQLPSSALATAPDSVLLPSPVVSSVCTEPMFGDGPVAEQYRRCLAYLFNRRVVKFGLESVSAVAAALGHPERKFSVVHVAGTNGKGSCVIKVAKCLLLKGLRVGVFTSPHICTFRERITVNGQMIPLLMVVQLTELLATTAHQLGVSLTFFEYVTLMAYCHFASEEVDWAVVETGLGGRLDATNIVERPKVAVITSIGWDHMAILGSSLSSIAVEKAGIIKSRCPVVLGPTAATHQVIWDIAEAHESEVWDVKPDARGTTVEEENRSIAMEVVQRVLRLDLLKRQLQLGLVATPPFRLQLLTADEMAVAQKRAEAVLAQHLAATTSEAPGDPTDAAVTLLGGQNETDCQQPSVQIPPLPPPGNESQIIIDVGHNETALKRVAQDIGDRFFGQPIRICLCFSHDRPPCVALPFFSHFLFPKNNRLVAIHYLTMPHHRVKRTDKFLKEVDESERLTDEEREIFYRGLREVHWWKRRGLRPGDPREDWEKRRQTPVPRHELLDSCLNISPELAICSAVRASAQDGGVLLIAGTFFMMIPVLRALGISVGFVDELDMNELTVSLK
eukprot:GHVT01015609.1.p1 GENE.GHVT01015609.1~~GHVT01015609.1.p1  ORF type:complete len:862 (+),score=149.45 GHVT01015609.1:1909-4494(+)